MLFLMIGKLRWERILSMERPERLWTRANIFPPIRGWYRVQSMFYLSCFSAIELMRLLAVAMLSGKYEMKGKVWRTGP